MSKMRAVRFHGQKDIRFEEIAEPSVGKGQVKVKPSFCGICGTDLHEYLGGANLIPSDTPHQITGETAPLTLGHEFSGIIEEVSSDLADTKYSGLKKGDRVCIQPTIYDDSCRSCKRGLVNCCDKNGFIGLSGWGGGLAEHIVVPASCVKPLPSNVSLEVGALIEPLAVGWHAVSISPYKDGDSCLVLGGGPIGLAVVQALKAKGCGNIIVSEIAPARKRFAQQFGAHAVVDPMKQDVVEEVDRLTKGLGADVAFDCAGVQVGLDGAMRAVKARGTVVNIAVWEKRASLAMNDVIFRERAYMGVATYALGDFEEVLKAISEGRLTPEGMITKKIALDRVEEDGFRALIEDKDNHVKILVDLGAKTGTTTNGS